MTERKSSSPTWGELCLDPRWQKLRLQVFERDEWACIKCSRKDQTLHAHHLWYGYRFDEAASRPKRRLPWEYELRDLATLCADCHEEQRDECTGDLADDLEQILKQNGLLRTDIASIAQWLIPGTSGPTHRLLILDTMADLTEAIEKSDCHG